MSTKRQYTVKTNWYHLEPFLVLEQRQNLLRVYSFRKKPSSISTGIKKPFLIRNGFSLKKGLVLNRSSDRLNHFQLCSLELISLFILHFEVIFNRDSIDSFFRARVYLSILRCLLLKLYSSLALANTRARSPLLHFFSHFARIRFRLCHRYSFCFQLLMRKLREF